jgi:probable rRNA maturation factor
MKIYWDETPLPDSHRTLLTSALTACVAYGGMSVLCEVNISFVSAEEMQKLNRDYRGMDNVTDVLSFPGFAGSSALGDIVICLEVAARQALEHGHSYERELAFLTVHSFLHLIGYTHDDREEEEKMCTAQEDIMQRIGVTR